MGSEIIGPRFSSIEKDTPIPSKGSLMSANMTAASTPSSFTGRKETSEQITGDLHTTITDRAFLISLYCGKYLPAWRMNHTGVQSTGSLLHAASSRSLGFIRNGHLFLLPSY